MAGKRKSSDGSGTGTTPVKSGKRTAASRLASAKSDNDAATNDVEKDYGVVDPPAKIGRMSKTLACGRCSVEASSNVRWAFHDDGGKPISPACWECWSTFCRGGWRHAGVASTDDWHNHCVQSGQQQEYAVNCSLAAGIRGDKMVSP